MRASFHRAACWLGALALGLCSAQAPAESLLPLMDSNLAFTTLPYSTGESFVRPGNEAPRPPLASAGLGWHASSAEHLALSGLSLIVAAPELELLDLALLPRDDAREPGRTAQLSGTWLYAFGIGDSEWLLDGGLDWAGSEGSRAAGFGFSPQLSFDAGDYFFSRERELLLGLQYLQQSGGLGQGDDRLLPLPGDQRALRGTLRYRF